MTDRNRAMVVAATSAMRKTAAAKAASRAKKEENRPSKALEESWFEIVRMEHGVGAQISLWSAAERNLAKLCLKTADLETVLRDVRHFVSQWCKRRAVFPSFRLYYSVRDSIHAEVIGTVKPLASKKDLGEFDAEEAKKFSRNGWGK